MQHVPPSMLKALGEGCKPRWTAKSSRFRGYAWPPLAFHASRNKAGGPVTRGVGGVVRQGHKDGRTRSKQIRGGVVEQLRLLAKSRGPSSILFNLLPVPRRAPVPALSLALSLRKTCL
jgi:hypothetical protein